MGYESSNFLKNQSTVSIYLLFSILKIIFYLTIWFFFRLFKIRIFKRLLKKWSFFKMIGELLSICLECYMGLLITGYMAVRANLWRNGGDVLGNILAYFFLSVVVFLLPFFAGIITIKEKDSIKSRKLKYVCR